MKKNDRRITDLVIDLETLGCGSDAAILSIGAAGLDEECHIVGDGYYKTVNLQSCLDAGMTLDGETLSWWMRQESAVRDVFDEHFQRWAPSIGEALDDFTGWCGAWCVDADRLRVWGTAADFDTVILLNAYKLTGREGGAPWRYRNSRCLTTARDLLGANAAPVSFGGVRNTALDDARHEARMLQEILWVCEREPAYGEEVVV